MTPVHRRERFGPLRSIEDEASEHTDGKLRSHAYPEDDLNWWQGTLLLCVVGIVSAFLIVAFA